jgi:hypothetical protein
VVFFNIGPLSQIFKSFYGRNLRIFVIIPRVFVQPFPALYIVCAQGQEPYPRVEQMKGTSIGYVLALPTSITQGLKGLLKTNTVACYEHS